MIVLHITPTVNLNSITQRGIKASPPLLNQFDDYMKKRTNKYDQNIGLVFAIPEDTIRRDKYIKDFVYWKLWGNPRNELLHKIGNDCNAWDKVYDTGYNYFKYIIPKDAHFHIMQFEISDGYQTCLHAQFGDMGGSKIWTNMDIKYEHCNKPLVLINENISPKKLSLFGTTCATIDRYNKFNISIKTFKDNNWKKKGVEIGN